MPASKTTTQPIFGTAEERVRAYYDANSKRFLRYGQGGGQGAIHRAVWAPEVNTRDQAFNYVNQLVVQQLETSNAKVPRVLDLGCGVGASLIYLAEKRAIEGVGVTLSEVQVNIAKERFCASSSSSTLHCHLASFVDVPEPTASFDLLFAIESFVLTDQPALFFKEAARLLKPGGVLVLVDDFLARQSAGVDAQSERWLTEFRRGWRVHTLCAVDELQRWSGSFTLEQQADLTPFLELNRPRDIAIRLLVSFGRFLPINFPWWGNLLGGNALQRCLLSGVLQYRALVFRRAAADDLPA